MRGPIYSKGLRVFIVLVEVAYGRFLYLVTRLAT